MSSERVVDQFLALSRIETRLALGVKSLHIFLDSVSIAKIKQCLLRAEDITDLELILNRTPMAGWMCLLRGIRFPSLRYFRSNAPHSIVASFLARHPCLAYISVERCNKIKRACPLETISLPKVSDVTGPIACISSIVANKSLVYVAASCDSQRDLSISMPNFTTRLAPSITRLSLPFDAVDLHFVRHIATAMPSLIALYLREKPGQQQVGVSDIISSVWH